jgi:hypothetical protein
MRPAVPGVCLNQGWQVLQILAWRGSGVIVSVGGNGVFDGVKVALGSGVFVGVPVAVLVGVIVAVGI